MVVQGRRRQGGQRGYAMLFIVIAIMGVSFIMVRTLNASTWRADRLRVTNAALAQAKEALIARAVADDNRPGSLPCPDTDDDGTAELFAGNDCPSYIGRLPWRTLDLPDIRDAEGERLWYVLSPSHRDHGTAEPINSDTIGTINVVDTAPSTGVVAVVIAPGRALTRAGAAGGQVRDCPANCNNAVNYLDAAGGVDNAVWAPVAGVATVTGAAETGSFNDRVLAITRDDIMRLVERRVAREIAVPMRARYEGWQAATGRGFYPWAAPFNDPANPGLGVNGTLHGHLPVTATPLVWTSASASLGSCAGVGTPTLTCSAVILLGQVLDITASVDNIATRFSEPPVAPVVAGLPIISNHTWTLNSASQRLDFNYTAVLGIVTVTVQAPVLSSWAPATAPWLVNNQWNRVATYAISQGHRINGPGVCNVANPCISLGGPADKEAVVLMTGRSLAWPPVPRPSALPAPIIEYLEGANATPADLALERRLPTTAFNDQPFAVRP
jgi:hypothetical protein